MSMLDAIAGDLAIKLCAITADGCSPPAGAVAGLAFGDAIGLGAAGFRKPAPADGSAEPMTSSTHHDVASVTKVLATTTALMALVSAGDFSLDTPVARYVPTFRGDGKERVAVRQLLTHRGGLWEWWPLYLAANGGDPIDAAAAMPLRYEPDTGRHYSDLGFMLLGRVIERAAARPLAEAVGSLVWEPLGLAETAFGAPRSSEVATSAFDDQIERAMIDSGEPYPVPFRSSDFEGWRSEPIVGTVNDGNSFHAFSGVAGHAGAFTTVSDLLRFALAMSAATDGDITGIDAAVAREFFTAGPDAEQALGWRTWPCQLAGDEVVLRWHPGFVGCAVGFVPGRRVAVAFATNRLVTPVAPVDTAQLWSESLAALNVAATQEVSS